MERITQFSQLDLTKTYTYADYLNWQFPEYVELLNGRVLPLMPGRSPAHQTILANMLTALRSYSKHHRDQIWRIPFDVRLAKDPAASDQPIRTVVQPDLFIVRDTTKIDDRGCVGAPDWIVEIFSPGFTTRDTHVKFDLYEKSEVQEYWLVFPGLKTVAAFTLVDNRYKLTDEYTEPGPIPVTTIPDLELEWAEIFDAV